MTRYQLLLLPALAGAILVLGGALHQRAPASRPFLEVDGRQANDTEALELLDRAIVALDPAKMPWMECKLWQQGTCEDFDYQTCGRLLTASGDRSRFDLNVKVGNTVGELRLVCDGKALRQSMRLGDDNAMVTYKQIPLMKDHFHTATGLDQARARFLQENGVTGLDALLRGVRQQMRGARWMPLHWNGRDVFVIAGALTDEPGPMMPGQELVRPHFQVRQGVVFLDAQTLWPHRLEWWGAARPEQPPKLLLQTEFRNPVLNQPLSPERCAVEFALSTTQ